MRKGRPESIRVPGAGSPTGDDPRHHAQKAQEEFDPFEDFDAHDVAAGHGKQPAAEPQGDVYTRSRRTPGDAGRRASRYASRSDGRSGSYSASRSSAHGATDDAIDSAADSAPVDVADATHETATTPQRPVRSLKSRALGYLSRREYSRAELSRKLIPHTEDVDELERLLDLLERENWLSDSRFAESLIHRRASRLGANRIVGELKRHAVDSTLIEEAASQLRETELTRAQAVWRKKYGELPTTPAERARQARFLAARGFSSSTISKILKGLDEDWPEG